MYPSSAVTFDKYQACGNDFILIQKGRGEFLDPDSIRHMCARKYGVGADGVIVYDVNGTSISMHIFNADGNEALMCGNGARALAQHAIDRLGVAAGVLETRVGGYPFRLSGGQSAILMRAVTQVEEGIVLDGEHTGSFVHSGTQHLVIFTQELAGFDRLAKGYRHMERFAPTGVNVNFAKVVGDGDVLVRVFEKGVEDETEACGTGAWAVAHLMHQAKPKLEKISVGFSNGKALLFAKEQGEFWMSGEVKFVFSGQIDLKSW
ncbi:MAG: Diaminopimelate epimerase [Chlamydiia bacterium]|nr:Diaminopimelate epimerase [Chlamydiia bacterium]